MKIESYAIDSRSYYSFEKTYEKNEKLQVWYSSPQNNVQSVEQKSGEPVLKLSDEDKAKLRMIKYLLEKLTGKKVRLLALEIAENEEGIQNQEQASQTQSGQGFGLIYESSEKYSESEKMFFSSSGIVKTSDGRTIEFSLSLKMERSIQLEKYFQLRLGDALKDPLVLNFDNLPVNFSGKKIKIDLDLDGIVDEFKAPSKDVGFLALDINENGKIDDGRELFGPTTGNGFKELSRYDSDGNKWIDEADPIFAKLKIWMIDEDGNQKLLSLKEMNVGAIYLGFVPSKFSMYDSQEMVGQLASSSIYLTEDGQPKTIHQINLKV
ncbi:MAG TPA: hypothetical protein PLP64_09530 [Pseudothermotoga sp.]|nr:hypothetical protein [Pseudothermotoga sp.]